MSQQVDQVLRVAWGGTSFTNLQQVSSLDESCKSNQNN